MQNLISHTDKFIILPDDHACERSEESRYPQDNEDSIVDKIDWIKRNPNKFQNFIINLNSENSFKSKRQAQFDKADGPISYPEVVANPLSNIPQPQPQPIMSYGNFLSFADPTSISVGNNSKTLPVTTAAPPIQTVTVNNATNPPVIATNGTKETPCARFLNSDNATVVLEKVLEELELIRKTKEGNSTPEGIKHI